MIGGKRLMPNFHYYLSGPMTGYPNYNFDAFNNSADRLRKQGFTVYNPAESFDGAQDLPWTVYMKNDYEAILKCGAVMVLEGWEAALGSVLEVVFALSRGMSIFEITGYGHNNLYRDNGDDTRNDIKHILKTYIASIEPKKEHTPEISSTPKNVSYNYEFITDTFTSKEDVKAYVEKRRLFNNHGFDKNMKDEDNTVVKSETILEEAQRLVHGDRGEAYGHPLDDFSRTAEIWSAILGIPVSAEQVSLCMVGLKISREVNKPKRDNRTDGAGYFETLDMVREERARRERVQATEDQLIEYGIID